MHKQTFSPKRLTRHPEPKLPDGDSEPTSVQSDGMASINKCYESERFSEEARKLLSASWRKGTQKDYCSKFKQFNSWCCSRQIDPNSISLSQIALIIWECWPIGKLSTVGKTVESIE
jgi:hypothetical protein